VESHLGHIDTWPSYVIECLVVDTPTPEVVKELTSFFFGNGVSISLAYRLYQTCNPAATTETVRELFYLRYFLGHRSSSVRRMTVYYNMSHKRFMYLDGSYYAQFEPLGSVEPGIGMRAPRLGIARSCCPATIRRMLERVRQEQL
jgi:hypothetical protein